MHAASDSWNVDADANWNAAGSWAGAQVPGSGTSDNSDVATFSFTLTGSRAVTVDATRYIGGISFWNTSSFGHTLQTGGLRLNSGGVVQTLSGNGNHIDTISATIRIDAENGSGTFMAGATSPTSLLAISGGMTGNSSGANTTTLTLNGANTGVNTVSGIIGNGAAGGKLALIKSGPGRWILTGANTFTGGVTLNDGTLLLNNATALGTVAGTLTITGGTLDGSVTLTANNPQAWNGDFAHAGLAGSLNLGTGAVTMNASRQVTVCTNTLTVGGAIGDSGSMFGLTKAGNGALVLAGANTFTGGVTLNEGTLTLQNATAPGGGAGTLTITGGTLDSGTADLVISANNTQNWNGNFAFAGTQNLNLGTGAVAMAASRQVTVNSKILTVGGVISGSGFGITKVGAGTLTLNGSAVNTFTGGLTVNGGTNLLDFANMGTPTDLINSANSLAMGNGTFRVKGKSAGSTSQTLGNVIQNVGAGQILVDPNGGAGTTLALGTLTASTPGTSLLIGQAAAGTAAITTASNKDAQSIYGGRVVFTSDGGTTVDWATTASGGAPYTLSAYAGYTAMVGGATTDTANDSTGTLALTGNHRHNSLKITTGATLSGAYSLNLNSGGLLSVGAGASTISVGSITADYNLDGAFDLIVHQYNTGGLTISAAIVDNGSNPTSLTKSGPGQLTLSGGNTFTGGTTFNEGTIYFTTDSAFGTAPLTINGGTLNANGRTIGNAANWNGDFIYSGANGNLTFSVGTITLGGSRTLNVSANTLTIANTITDGGAGYSLTKTGGGTLVLNGTVAYSGITTVNAGSLRINGTNTATGGITVNNGAVLYIGSSTALGTGPLIINTGAVIDNTSGAPLTISTATPQNWMGDPTFRVVNSGGQALNMGTGTITLNGPPGSRTVYIKANNLKDYAAFTFGGMIQNGTASGLTVSFSPDIQQLVVLAGTNTYTGETFVDGRTSVLRATDGIGLPAASLLTVQGGVFETGADLVRFGGSLPGQMRLTASGNMANGFSAYGGPVRLCYGTLASPESLTWGAGNFVVGNGGLILNDYTANNTLDFKNAVSLGNSARQVNVYSSNPAAITTISGILSSSGGSGGLTKAGAGVLVLSAPNTFQGQLIVSAGTLSVGTVNNDSAAGPLGNSANSVSISGGATLEYSGVTVGSTKRFTLATAGSASNFQIDGAGTILTLSGAIDGAGILAKVGPGTLILSGANTYSGGVTVNGGVLKLTNANGYTADTTVSVGTLTLADQNAVQSSTVSVVGGGLVFDSSVAGNAFTFGGLKGTMSVALVNGSLNSVVLTVGGNNQDTAYYGNFSGGGSITKTGTGTLTLNGANTFTGGITISGGTLLFRNTAALPGYATATVPVGNGGTLAVCAGVPSPSEWSSTEIDALLVNGNVTFAAGAYFGINTGSGDFTYGTSITNANTGLVKLGANNLTLTNANTFTGGLAVSGGRLKLDFAALATPTDLVNSGNALALGGGTLYVQGKDNAASAQTLGNLTLNPGGSALAVTNGASSTLNLTVGNTWSRTALNGSTLNVTLGTGGTLTSSPGLTYGIIGPWATIGSGTSTKYATVVVGVIADYTGGTAAAGGANLVDTTGQVNYDLNGAGGTAAATFSGNTIRYTAGAGTTAPGATSFKVNGLLNTGSGLWTIGTSMFTIGDTRELIVNTASAANNDITISSVIADNGGGASKLVKTGAGTLTLSATSTYTGKTVVNGGILAITTDRNVGAVPGAFTADSITLNNGSTLAMSSAVLDSKRGITLGNGIQTITSSANNSLPVISGSGGLDLNMNGARLNISHLYTGDTRILGGVAIQSGSPFQFSTVTSGPGSQIWANQTGSSTFGGISGTWDLPLSAQFGGAMTLLVGNNNKDTTYNGVLSAGGSLTKIGIGTLTMTNNANTFTGSVTVQSGTLAVGTINNASANGPLGNSANAVTLGYTNNVSGTLRMIGTNAAYASNKRFVIADCGIGVFQVDNAGTTQTLSGAISGGGALTKAGAGGLILSGTNTFTGPLTVSSGTLGGFYGSAAGVLTNKSGATLSPGAVPGAMGTFTNAGNAMLEAGSALTVDLGWTSCDRLAAGGTVSLGGTITFVTNAPLMSQSYTVVSSGSARNGEFAATNGLPPGFSVVYDANSVLLARDPSPIINVLGTNGALITMGTNVSSLALGTDFGYGAAGTSTTNTFVVTNLGANTLTLSGAPVVISGHTDFTVNPQPGTTVTSSNSVSFSIVFTPSANLSRTGIVIIASDDAMHSPYTFAIRGGQLNGIWTNDASGFWSDSFNWLDSGMPQGATYAASFATNITAARTVTNNLSNLSIGRLSFEDTSASHNWTLAGNSIRMDNAGNGSNIMVSNQTATISCVVTGAETIVKSGPGTLSLTGVNTFSGKIVVNGGTLYLGLDNAAVIGVTPATMVPDQITLNGAKLDGVLAGYSQKDKVGIFLGPDGGTNSLGTWLGPISGSGNLTITAADFRMNGATGPQTGAYDSTYTGDTIIAPGASVCPYRINSLQYSTLDLSYAVNGLRNIGGTSPIYLGGLKGTQNEALPSIAGGLFIGNNSKDTTYSGVLSGSGTPIIKIGAGTLTLTGNNSYTGATTVNGGTLALSGASGAIASSVGVAIVGGGMLKLDNTTNNANRIGTVGIALNGGTLNFTNDAAAGVNYSETVGALTNAGGANVIAAAQAAVGQTSTLTFSSLTRTAGTLDFVGVGLGVDGRNKIIITGQANGLIGPWATVNGTELAAYDSVMGVYAYSGYTDIAYRSSTIASNAIDNVRISLTNSTPGNIALDSTITIVSNLLQNYTQAATVDTAAKTLRLSGIAIAPAMESLTIGTAANSGVLTAQAAGGELTLNNNSTGYMTINAVISDNSTASGVIKGGTGPLVLLGNNTFTGTLTIGAGTLALGATGSGPNTPLGTAAAATTVTATGAALDMNGFTLATPEPLTLNGTGVTNSGALLNSSATAVTWSGPVTLASSTRINAPSGAIAFDVTSGDAIGGAGQNLTLGGAGNITLKDPIGTGSGSVTKDGAGTVTFSVLNTYSGGTTVSAGVLKVNNATGSGTGSGTVTVKTNATLVGGGTISGAVTIEGGGHLAPGASTAGSLTISAANTALNFNTGAILDYEIGGTPGSPTNDLVNLTGGSSTVAFGSTAVVNLYRVPGGPTNLVGTTFVLFDYTGSNPILPAWTINHIDTGYYGGTVSVDVANSRIVLTGLTTMPPRSGTTYSFR